MKTILIIILALFTLTSCKFSYDKAKVEESYGSFEGGGDSGGGGGGSPTCDPDPTQSSILADSNGVADNFSVVNITVTIKDCNGMPVEGVTPILSITGVDNPSATCLVPTTDVNGIVNCTMTSTYAEPTKTISIASPAILSSTLPATVAFSAPTLTLHLKACLAGASTVSGLPMNPGVNLPQFSPYNFSSWFTGGNIGINPTPQPSDVDWVLIQVYSDTELPLVAKSAIIHTDGTITEPGLSPGTGITFSSGLSDDYNANYKINIMHRNHLSVGLDDPITRSTLTPIDLTSSTNYRPYIDPDPLVISLDPYIEIGLSNTKCLRAGDFDNNYVINVTDINDMYTYIDDLVGLNPNLYDVELVGYHSTDMNLNNISKLLLQPSSEQQDVTLIRSQIPVDPLSTLLPRSAPWNNGF